MRLLLHLIRTIFGVFVAALVFMRLCFQPTAAVAAENLFLRRMTVSNPTWGEERIADELLLKIGIQISPRTVRRYMPKTPNRPADPSQRWMTFVRNHAKAIIASDFFVVVTATFQLVYVFVH